METIEWKISGPLNSITINGITQIGVIEENIETVREKSKKMPELLQYFKSYSEFYTDTTYQIPENINQVISSETTIVDVSTSTSSY